MPPKPQDDPIWISLPLVLAIHQRQIAEHGGSDGLRDPGLLDSALNRARHLFAYADPPSELSALAAAYAFGIAKNHPFLDGNKRTAAVVCETFLNLNGLELTANDTDMYLTFLSLAAGDLSEPQLALWLKHNTQSTT